MEKKEGYKNNKKSKKNKSGIYSVCDDELNDEEDKDDMLKKYLNNDKEIFKSIIG